MKVLRILFEILCPCFLALGGGFFPTWAETTTLPPSIQQWLSGKSVAVLDDEESKNPAVFFIPLRDVQLIAVGFQDPANLPKDCSKCTPDEADFEIGFWTREKDDPCRFLGRFDIGSAPDFLDSSITTEHLNRGRDPAILLHLRGGAKWGQIAVFNYEPQTHSMEKWIQIGGAYCFVSGWKGRVGISFEDLDGDGLKEIVTNEIVGIFTYTVPEVYRLENHRYVQADWRYPKVYAEAARDYEKQLKTYSSEKGSFDYDLIRFYLLESYRAAGMDQKAKALAEKMIQENSDPEGGDLFSAQRRRLVLYGFAGEKDLMAGLADKLRSEMGGDNSRDGNNSRMGLVRKQNLERIDKIMDFFSNPHPASADLNLSSY